MTFCCKTSTSTCIKTLSVKGGFTLVELLISITITVVVVGALAVVLNITTKAYKDSSNKIESQAKAEIALDQISSDLESFLIQPGNEYEWLWIGRYNHDLTSPGDGVVGPDTHRSTKNIAHLIFLNSPLDRYDGDLLTEKGNVCCVSYRVAFRDEVATLTGRDPTADPRHSTFALYRTMVDPDATFATQSPAPNDSYIAVEHEIAANGVTLSANKTGLANVFRNLNPNGGLGANSILVEGIYEMSIHFTIQFNDAGIISQRTFAVTPDDSNAPSSAAATYVSIKGNRIDTDLLGLEDVINPRLISMNITLGVLTSQGVQKINQQNDTPFEQNLKESLTTYSREISIPRY